MFGWFRAARTCASRWNRANRSAIAASVGRQHLDRDLALQIRVRRSIDLAHAAGTQGRLDLVRTEAGAGAQGQALRIIARPDVAPCFLRGAPSETNMQAGAEAKNEARHPALDHPVILPVVVEQ